MDNNLALNIIEKYVTDNNDKQFIKNHIENLSSLLNILQSENEFIRKNNNIEASYNSSKVYLTEQYKNIVLITDKITELLSDSICEECGHVAKNNLRKLADYIITLSEFNDNKLFNFVMENKLESEEPKEVKVSFTSK